MEHQQTSQPTAPEHHEKKRNWYKIVVFAALGVFLTAGLVFAGYYAGLQKNTPYPTITPAEQSNSVPSSEPTVQKGESFQDAGIPIKDTTVSFARVSGKTYLRYKGKIYGQDQQYTPEEIKLANENQYTWYGLLDIPVNTAGFDEVFSFKILPNNRDFVFVVRYDVPTAPDKFKQEIKAYYYNTSESVDKLTLLFSGVSPDLQNQNAYNYAKIDQISSSGKYVSFQMFGCWNCGGHQPEQMVYNLETKASKNIGKVSYFKWTTNGNYEYKEYIGIPCPTPEGAKEGEYMEAECPKDPSTLPLKTGQI